MPANLGRLRTLLDRLDEHLGRDGCPIAGLLEPGLSESAIDAAVGRVGLRLPVEARVWWQWHNGTRPGTLPSGRTRLYTVGGGFALLSLDQALDDLRRRRVTATQGPGVFTAEELWDPAWFPLSYAGYGGTLAVDCSVPEGEPTPVRVVDWQDVEGWRSVRAPSLTQVVEWWVEMYDQGIYRWNPAKDWWNIDWDRIPRTLRLTSLV